MQTTQPVAPIHRDAHLEGGLLDAGTTVRVTLLTAPPRYHDGEIVDLGSVPAAYLTLDTPGGHIVVFLGPGVIIEYPSKHPALT